jgi:hypothetical protein
MLDVEKEFTWSAWQPLEQCWLGDRIPDSPGLYRIRRLSGNDIIDYIGQTGIGTMHLRKRLAMLKGLYAEQMPYRDPHTAAPALWALRDSQACSFEVSVSPVSGSTQWRKGLEALAISLYRQERLQSPTVNFGRILEGYRMPSSNSKKLVAAGKRFLGGVTAEHHTHHLAGVPPMGGLIGDCQSGDWSGHLWSDWQPLSMSMSSNSRQSLGLYRLRDRAEPGLLYIGEGAIFNRFRSHGRKARNPQDEPGRIFAQAKSLECSWVVNNAWLAHQRLELETDLIAAHVLTTQSVPRAQFLGKAEQKQDFSAAESGQLSLVD